MPVLMIALIALAAFGVIGLLLFVASLLEVRTESRHQPAPAAGKH